MSEQYLVVKFSKHYIMAHINFWKAGEGLPQQEKKICQQIFKHLISINVDGHCSLKTQRYCQYHWIFQITVLSPKTVPKDKTHKNHYCSKSTHYQRIRLIMHVDTREGIYMTYHYKIFTNGKHMFSDKGKFGGHFGIHFAWALTHFRLQYPDEDCSTHWRKPDFGSDANFPHVMETDAE